MAEPCALEGCQYRAEWETTVEQGSRIERVAVCDWHLNLRYVPFVKVSERDAQPAPPSDDAQSAPVVFVPPAYDNDGNPWPERTR